MSSIARLLLPLTALLVLCACILVEDYDSVWEKAKPDSCVTKIAESLYYSEYRRDPQGKDMSKLARVWTVDGYNFLLLKQDEADAGGRMYRFGVVQGIFQRYRLVPTMRATFEKEYPNAPVSLKHDTVQLAKLDAPTIKLLSEISAKSEYWEIDDQTLYNTMRNPACRFEDRDLKAKE
ncbi:MAG: hypothetical protein V4735_07010 [Pseudomonadota bacterium]